MKYFLQVDMSVILPAGDQVGESSSEAEVVFIAEESANTTYLELAGHNVGQHCGGGGS